MSNNPLLPRLPASLFGAAALAGAWWAWWAPPTCRACGRFGRAAAGAPWWRAGCWTLPPGPARLKPQRRWESGGGRECCGGSGGGALVGRWQKRFAAAAPRTPFPSTLQRHPLLVIQPFRRALLDGVIRLSCRIDVQQDVRRVLGPVPPESHEAYRCGGRMSMQMGCAAVPSGSGLGLSHHLL